MKRFALAIRRTTATLALCLALPLYASAQSRSAPGKASGSGSHKLLVVKAAGTKRYTDPEILAASRLEVGQDAAEGNFQEAAQRLVNSGVFTEVAYSFSYTDTGVKLEFQLTDIDKAKLVPAHFENFIWFTESDLRSALAHRVPLFKDALPAGGRLSGEVAQALQAMLAERHLPGRVDFLRQAKRDGGDVTGFVFRVEDLSVRIRNVDFPGASPEQAAFLALAARKLVKAPYSRSAIAAVAQYDFLPLFLQRGYLKAAFGPAEAHVVAPPSGQPAGNMQSPNPPEEAPTAEIEVDAIVPATPGKQYLVSEVSWKGNSAVTMLESAPFFHLSTGQPADAVRLEQDIGALLKLYRSRGYMTAQIKPEPQMDDEKNTVRYQINVAEGDLYKMGELDILGADTASKDRLHEAWKLGEGQPYNADYTRQFLDGTHRFLPPGLHYSVKLSEQLNAKDKTVDVTLHFITQ